MLTCKTTSKDGLPKGKKWDAKAVRLLAEKVSEHTELRYWTLPSATWGGEILGIVKTGYTKAPEIMISIHFIRGKGYGVTEHFEEDVGISPVPRVLHKDLMDAIKEATPLLKK